ncbi:hypothetical protein ACE1BS_00055 [Aeromonas jandaei]
MKNINWTFVYVALVVGGGAIYTALSIYTRMDEVKKNESELKKELSITHSRVKSDCQLSTKEKQFDSRGHMTITEKYVCPDGFDYSFSIPSESN